jgi:hypothetical protein
LIVLVGSCIADKGIGGIAPLQPLFQMIIRPYFSPERFYQQIWLGGEPGQLTELFQCCGIIFPLKEIKFTRHPQGFFLVLAGSFWCQLII